MTDKYAELVRTVETLLRKATPHPWYCDCGATAWPASVAAGGPRGSPSFRRIALCGSPRAYQSAVDREHEANALLISLAPELLDNAAAAITELQARVRELEDMLKTHLAVRNALWEGQEPNTVEQLRARVRELEGEKVATESDIVNAIATVGHGYDAFGVLPPLLREDAVNVARAAIQRRVARNALREAQEDE